MLAEMRFGADRLDPKTRSDYRKFLKEGKHNPPTESVDKKMPAAPRQALFGLPNPTRGPLWWYLKSQFSRDLLKFWR